MKIKGTSRAKKQHKARYGHKVSGRSVFLTQEILVNRSKKAKAKKAGK